jgi:hypothetical protein
MPNNLETLGGSFDFAYVAPRDRPRKPEANRHAEAFKAGFFRVPAIYLAGILAAFMFVAPTLCKAEDDTPSVLGYALEGFGTGFAVGLATGFVSTGHTFEGGEWRKLVWGAGIGALGGVGIGLILGIVDAGTTPHGRGVGFYIMRDSNYGFSVGALVGGVVGALVWASGGRGKDFLWGLAWGTIIGAGTGVILGIVEGALRNRNGGNHESASARRVQIGLGFTPSEKGSAPIPYPMLSGHF